MRQLLLVLVTSSVLTAAPCPTSVPLTTYLAASFTCEIGDKSFGSFAAVLSAVSVGGTATPALFSDITVIPFGGSGNPGFTFDANFEASTASLISAASTTFTVAYTGTAPSDHPFVETTMFLTNADFSGLGVVTAAEALCLNGSFTSPLNPLLCSGVGVNTTLASNITNANLAATITFSTPPVTLLGVIKNVTLNSGLGGSATLDAINNGYTAAVPEPSTGALIGLPLLLAALWRARSGLRS